MNTWHQSHLPAQLPALPSVTDKQAGNRALEVLRGQLRRPVRAAERAPVFFSWSNTPEAFRRLVARAALLSEDVVHKLDRDLSEPEKAAIRAAARRLRERADQLFAI